LRQNQRLHSSQQQGTKSLYGKEKTASPTISTDALMMSILIDAWEKRDVATANVSGA
jgi:hypothetical protein